MRNDDLVRREAKVKTEDSGRPDNELEGLKSRLRWAQGSQALAVRILTLLNRPMKGRDAIRNVLHMVKDFTGFEAVAIRLREGEDYPYFVTNGFPQGFVEAEKYLCDRNEAGEIVRDTNGNAVLACMCGNILRGRTNPAFSFFTEGGSFWSCHTTELLATTSEADRQARTRNTCNSAGYESVALIPLRSGGETIGLLQLNDSRKDCFTLDMITFFEGLGAGIGIVLARVKTEEALRRTGEELEIRVADRTEELRKANERLQLELAERKRAEEARQESEERFRAIFSIASVGIDLVDEQGRFLEVNNALSQILARTPNELRRVTVFDVSHPGDLDKSREMHEAMVHGEIDSYRLEKRYVRKGGEIIWADTAVSAIRDADGQYRATVGVVRDITHIKQSEEARVLLDAAVEQAAEAIVVTDAAGTIKYVNPAKERISGYSREELLGKNTRILKSGEHDAAFYRNLWDTVTAGNVWSGRFVNRRKDGLLYHEEATISPVKDASGKIVNYVAVKRDITEHLELSKQLQQAQKMEAIGTLAGGIAHDFNNVLQVTLGYSELLLGDEDLPPHCRSDLKKINESARRGADLVARLLTFSRKTEINPQPLNLNRRITELRKMLERTIPRMIEIKLSLSERLDTINADPTQIDQVLMNLAVNARDAMPEGGQFLLETSNLRLDEEYAKAHLEARPGKYVLLTVTDNGLGMDKDTLEHIFEPFYTTKAVGEGTGLGLAMVHGIVKQHGGHIWCYSEPGHGTTFRIYFPALVSDEEEEPTKSSPLPRGGSETILLVDDEELIRELGARILTKAGYKVITASNGREALEVYKTRKGEISLVILDLIMPEMGGKQCLQALLTLAPSLKVVIASGFSANGHTRDALASGAKGFVNKPYDLREVQQVVRDVLDAD